MGNQRARVQYSADGELWWDGAEWQPAYSEDRKYRFDGTTWVAQSTSGRPRLIHSERRIAWSLVALFAVWIVWAFWSARGAHVLPDGQINIAMTHAADMLQTVLSDLSLAFALIVTAWLVWRRRSALVGLLLGAMVLGMIVVMGLSNFLILYGDTPNGRHSSVASTSLVAGIFAALAAALLLEPLLIAVGLGALVGLGGRRLTRKPDSVGEPVR